MGVGLLCVLSATAYFVLGAVKLRTFRASTFDLVIFDQAVRGYAGFGPPTTPARGADLGQGLDFLQLADHFSPILATLAPLYWVYDHPITLIAAQSVLLALAAVPIWLYTRRKLGLTTAYLVAVTYVSSAAVAQAAGFDFHEVAFVPLLTAVLIERLDAGKVLPAALAALGLLLVKEDMGLLVFGFGCYLLVVRRYALGAAFAAAGVAGVALARGLLIPAAGGDPATFWAYGHLGADVPGLLRTFVFEPGRVLATFVTPDVKVMTMLGMVAPLLFACLLSPLILPAVPLVLERMLSDRAFWWTDTFQYNAFVVVVLILAAVDGVARVQRWADRLRSLREPRVDEDAPDHASDPAADAPADGDAPDPALDPAPVTGRHAAAHRTSQVRPLALAWAAAVCGISLALVPQHYLGLVFQPSFYDGGPDAEAAAAAADTVPSDVVVETVNNVGPALTDRTTVLLWEPRIHDAPWIVANTELQAYPFASVDDQRQRVADLEAAGYARVFDRGGYVVLHRPGSG